VQWQDHRTGVWVDAGTWTDGDGYIGAIAERIAVQCGERLGRRTRVIWHGTDGDTVAAEFPAPVPA
jgi:hypothetical protein